jgi:hypothetical protein
MTRAQWLIPAVLSAATAGMPVALHAQPQTNPTAAAVHAFQLRVDAYVKLHNQAEGKVPNLTETADPKKISTREAALGEAIRALRADARPGDIFCEEFRPVLLQLIRDDFAARSATDRRALVVELPAKFRLALNMTYPTTLPLVTVPAKLLSALPRLPEVLEYRILGRHLLLRDVTANLVVDFVRDAVPTIPS